MATLSRQEMEQVIKGGGSVLHDGRLYSRVESLPTEAALAKGNPEQEKAAAASLQRQMDTLKAELAKLKATPEQDAADTTVDTDDSKADKKGAKA